MSPSAPQPTRVSECEFDHLPRCSACQMSHSQSGQDECRLSCPPSSPPSPLARTRSPPPPPASPSVSATVCATSNPPPPSVTIIKRITTTPPPKMSYYKQFVLITILMCLTFYKEVKCEGIFQLRLDEYVNELNRDAVGNCCGSDHAHTNATTRLDEICEEKCEIYFRVCFLNYQANIDTNATCHYGENTTHILDSQQGSSVNYQFDFSFNFSWPGTFSLIIEAWTDSSKGDAPAHHKLHTRKSLVARFPESRGIKLTVGPHWTQRSRTVSNNRLQYSYRVLCEHNYYGRHCKTKCTARDDIFGHYHCGLNGEKVCHQGWNGTYCEKAICDACNTSNGDCKGPNYCKCRPGWTGEDCNTCERYIGCKEGYCNKAYECICKEGWGGLLCNLDLNYCTNHRPCKNGGQCTNSGQGSFTCECPPGFTGLHCETKVDSCLQQPCLNNATCKSHPHKNYVCECTDSYYGRHCEHQSNPCKKNNPCENGGECSYGPSGVLCSCKIGYSGNKCELKQKGCAPNPCKHGGNCVLNSTSEAQSNSGAYICQCRAGFTGEHCEVNINDCETNACLNGGTCQDEVNSFRCQCTPGFVGEYCQVNVDDCLMKPCANGGTCMDGVNDYKCTCPPGYTGKDCSINIDECRGDPCFNGGTCHDRVNEYECSCPPNFTGARCEIVIKPAVSYDAVYKEQAEAPQAGKGIFSTPQMLLATVLSISLPLLVLFLAIVYFFCRHWKNYHEKEKIRRHDDEARRQNDHNTIMNTMNNKCFDQLNSSNANVIVNALDRPASLHQLNRCHKSSNEYTNFDKSKTLQKGFKLINSTLASSGKCLNSDLTVKLSMDDGYHVYEPIKKNDNLVQHHVYQTIAMPKKSNNYDKVDIYSALQANRNSNPSSVYTSCIPPSNVHRHDRHPHAQPRSNSVYVISPAPGHLSDAYTTVQSIYDDAKGLHATQV